MHPVTLFALFALAVVLASAVAEMFDVWVPDPRPEGARGRSPDGRIYAVSLMNAAGLRRIVENLVTNFTSFAPLGTVLASAGALLAARRVPVSCAVFLSAENHERHLHETVALFDLDRRAEGEGLAHDAR